MKLHHIAPGRRTGFTLVELLLVIAIIGVLISLVSAGLSQAFAKANQVKNQNEISQMSVAMEAFKTKFDLYPPSKLLLYSNQTDYNMAQQLDRDSVDCIKRMFPRINWTGINWGGTGTLEGDQCLVFFLGGPPVGNGANEVPGCQGFSSNPTNPTSGTGKSFYEFQSNRLVKRGGSAFFSYLDIYGSSDGKGNLTSGNPYAYFSANNRKNGYNPYGTSDCAGLGVQPYFEATGSPNRYLKPNSFQLISAGRNVVFGAGGGPWTPATAASVNAGNGADDQSNFYDSLLGTSTN